eukprot:TRINITY_DN758_c0_g1_i1.p1 TRINITY_DN758_c0_g1~~TRINITY_DN758_c0_g1_i1.p1  ORF type:complete len:372 (+),score=71.49 TRINITY_DN758_c0_g1_i1:43-1116(+)
MAKLLVIAAAFAAAVCAYVPPTTPRLNEVCQFTFDRVYDGNYTGTAFFVAQLSVSRNTPEIIYMNTGSEDTFDMIPVRFPFGGWVRVLGTGLDIATLTIEDNFWTSEVAPLLSSAAYVAVGTSYAVYHFDSDSHSLMFFTVLSYNTHGAVSIEFTVKYYAAVQHLSEVAGWSDTAMASNKCTLPTPYTPPVTPVLNQICTFTLDHTYSAYNYTGAAFFVAAASLKANLPELIYENYGADSDFWLAMPVRFPFGGWLYSLGEHKNLSKLTIEDDFWISSNVVPVLAPALPLDPKLTYAIYHVDSDSHSLVFFNILSHSTHSKCEIQFTVKYYASVDRLSEVKGWSDTAQSGRTCSIGQ